MYLYSTGCFKTISIIAQIALRLLKIFEPYLARYSVELLMYGS